MNFQKALPWIFLQLALLFSTTVAKAQDAGRLVNLNGSLLFVKSVGEGEPVIVIHGGPLLDHSYLLPYFQFMAEDHQLILYDQRLSGRSSAEVDTADIRMEMFVKDIEALRNHFGLEKVHVIGHSWGGLLAMEYAVAYPKKLRSLVLISPMPPNAELWEKEQEAANSLPPADSIKREKIIASGMLESNPARAVKEMLLLSFKQEFHDTAIIDSLDFFIPPDYLQRSRLFKQLLPYLQDYDLTDQLRGLEVPTLAIYGSDEAAKDISGPVMKAVFPSAELIIVPRSGHFSFIENPKYFDQIVKSFIMSAITTLKR